MNKKLLLLATSACVLTALVPASVVFGASESPQRQTEAQQLAQAGTPVAVNEILPKLKGKTQVPIFIPSSISASQKLYYQSTAKADSYTISIGYTANCNAGACSFGEIRSSKRW